MSLDVGAIKNGSHKFEWTLLRIDCTQLSLSWKVGLVYFPNVHPFHVSLYSNAPLGILYKYSAWYLKLHGEDGMLTSLILSMEKYDSSSQMGASSNWSDNQLDIFLDYNWKVGWEGWPTLFWCYSDFLCWEPWITCVMELFLLISMIMYLQEWSRGNKECQNQ